ncbi:MAG: glycosyltransferase [Crocinitomix sp.]|nr:glycosyltransferase [Crocinitomix sp.]
MDELKKNQTSKKKTSILVLPRWYPNKTDIQLGIFIQRQVALMQNEFQLQVVYAQAMPDLKQDYELISSHENGFEEHIVYFKSGKGFLKKLINLKRYKKAQQLGLKQVSGTIDICHIHVPYRPALLAFELLKKGIPFLVTEHWSGHLNNNYQRKNILDKLFYKRVLKKAKKISTVSKALQIAFKKNTGFDSTVIPNIIERRPKVEKSNSGKINFLSVGDFHNETKNFSGLLHAFKVVNASHPKTQLTLIGGGPDYEMIVNLAHDLKFPEGALIFTNRQNHEFVLNAMNNCDIYVCNSRFETFGMTVAEALLSGKPVVSTKCGGPEEFLSEANSILVSPSPPQDNSEHQELAEAMLKMTHTFKAYDSEKISTEVNLKFGEETVKEKWSQFYTL